MGTEVATQTPAAVLAKFVNDNKDRIAAAMPSGVRTELVTRSLLSLMQTEPKIAACTPQSLKKCLQEMVLCGLEVGKGIMGKAYIVPYGKEAQFQLGYKGIKELVRRSGKGDVIMAEVREGDTFEPQNKFTLPVHRESSDPLRHTKPITHVFAAYVPTVGRAIVEVWSVERCIAHRDQYSKGWKASKKQDNPWHPDNPAFAVMCMKCPVMYLAGRGDLPLSPDVQSMVVAADEGFAIEAAAVQVVEPAAIEQRDSTEVDKPSTLVNESTPEQDDTDTPAQVDMAWVAEKLGKITTLKATDDLQKELVEMFPTDKQQIYDRLEEHREQIQSAK